MTIEVDNSPPLFYINNGHLWYYHNMTAIYPVNVLNSTMTSQLPLQLSVGRKQEGVKGGYWRWQGTMLYYEQGAGSNSGAYYSCQDTTGLMGLYLYLKPYVVQRPRPERMTHLHLSQISYTSGMHTFHYPQLQQRELGIAERVDVRLTHDIKRFSRHLYHSPCSMIHPLY